MNVSPVTNRRVPARCEARGFTLIELLVVVAIISLLVSILLPSLNRAKELARQAICAANLHNLGNGVMLYANDYDGRTPPILSVFAMDALRTTGIMGSGGEDLNGPSGLGLLVETGLLDRSRDTAENLLWCPTLEHRSFVDKEVFIIRIIEDHATFQSFGYQQRYTGADIVEKLATLAGPSMFDLSGPGARSYLSDVWFGVPDDPHEGHWRTWYLDAHVEANAGPDDEIPFLSWNDHHLGWRSLDPE